MGQFVSGRPEAAQLFERSGGLSLSQIDLSFIIVQHRKVSVKRVCFRDVGMWGKLNRKRPIFRVGKHPGSWTRFTWSTQRCFQCPAWEGIARADVPSSLDEGCRIWEGRQKTKHTSRKEKKPLIPTELFLQEKQCLSPKFNYSTVDPSRKWEPANSSFLCTAPLLLLPTINKAPRCNSFILTTSSWAYFADGQLSRERLRKRRWANRNFSAFWTQPNLCGFGSATFLATKSTKAHFGLISFCSLSLTGDFVFEASQRLVRSLQAVPKHRKCTKEQMLPSFEGLARWKLTWNTAFAFLRCVSQVAK